MVSSRERCSTSHCKNERTSYSKSGRWKRVMLARQLHRWEQQLFLENLQRKRQPQTEGDDPPDCTEARSGRWERVVLTRQLPLAVIPRVSERVSAMEEAISNWGRWPNRRLHRGKLSRRERVIARPTNWIDESSSYPRKCAMEEARSTSNRGRWPNRMVHRGKLRSLRESDARPTAVKMRGAVIPRDHALEEATERSR